MRSKFHRIEYVTYISLPLKTMIVDNYSFQDTSWYQRQLPPSEMPSLHGCQCSERWCRWWRWSCMSFCTYVHHCHQLSRMGVSDREPSPARWTAIIFFSVHAYYDRLFTMFIKARSECRKKGFFTTGMNFRDCVRFRSSRTSPIQRKNRSIFQYGISRKKHCFKGK